MGHHAHGPLAGVGDQHFGSGHGLDEVRGFGHFLVDVEDDDVGLDAIGVNGEAVDVGQPLGQAAGILMVFGQPVHHAVQGHQPGGGQDTGLAHAATHHLAPSMGLFDEIFGAHQHRTHRAAQGLGQAEADIVHVAGQFLGRDLQGHGGVEDARAVQVHRHAGLMGHVADGLGVGGGHHHAAAPVMGVLKAEHGGGGEMGVALGPDGAGHVVWVDAALGVVGHQAGLGSGQGGLSPAFVPEHVGLVAHDDLVAPVAVGQSGDEVAHGAAGGQQAGFLAQHGGGPLLQLINGRVLAENVVAHLGLGHGPAHLAGGFGDCVAAQIDQCHLTAPPKN